MKARAVFDTLAYANRLKTAGLDPKIAETQAEANADMIANLLDNALLTKQDLLQSEAKLELQIKETHSDLEKQILQVQQQMKELEIRLTIRLGGIIAGSIGLTLSILHFMH